MAPKEAIPIPYAGLNFTYAGQASQNHDVMLVSFDPSASRSNGGSSMLYTTDKAPRSLKSHLLGATPDAPLEFELEIVCISGELPVEKLMFVKSWLCGQLRYEHLVIQHPDFEDVFFNCVFNDPEDIHIQGYNGIKVTCLCDAGGAWQNPKSKRFPIVENSKIVFNNLSHSNDYLYPTIKFTLKNGLTSFSIRNQTDGNRLTEFRNLLGGETITVNGSTGEVISSLNLNRVGNFNKHYLRFRRGLNILQCGNESAALAITWQNFIRLGGG